MSEKAAKSIICICWGVDRPADGPAWSVRASLANLNKEDYLKIGSAIRRILEDSKPSKMLILVGFIFLAVVAASAWILFGRDLVDGFRKKA